MAAKRKYWWERWLRQPRTVLLRGVDYHCSQSMMAQQVRSNASRFGVSVKITDTGTETIIDVIGEQADEVPHTDPAAVAG